jgi:hypothetical protein
MVTWVALLLAVGVVALLWLFVVVDRAELRAANGQRTWIVQPGDTVRLRADEVRPDDMYRCSGVVAQVEGTPRPGHRIANGPEVGMVEVSTAADGEVTVTCEPNSSLP